MSTTIKLSSGVMDEAKVFAEIYSRSIPKQIEYWFKIGKIAEENPDLNFNLIKDLLISQAEIENGQVNEYKFGK